ncbi:hypothetical protein [Halomicrobium katesii]|nr:hypothetical protein [Halomicrobium katesii]
MRRKTATSQDEVPDQVLDVVSSGDLSLHPDGQSSREAVVETST